VAIGSRWSQEMAHTNLGRLFQRSVTRQYDKAIEQFKPANTMDDQLGDFQGRISSCNNIGICFQNRDRICESTRMRPAVRSGSAAQGYLSADPEMESYACCI
jgi:hypothetical protein